MLPQGETASIPLYFMQMRYFVNPKFKDRARPLDSRILQKCRSLVNMESKTRSRSMGTLAEQSHKCLLAYTALRLEMGRKQVNADTAGLARAFEVRNTTNAMKQRIAEPFHKIIPVEYGTIGAPQVSATSVRN